MFLTNNSPDLSALTFLHYVQNKQPIGCEAQLACKCLFTPTFIDRRFGRVK